MMSFTADAQTRLDGYLRQLRQALRGSRSVDVSEVESDVMEHLQCELADRPQPVLLDDLAAALRKLGSPWQWVPAEDQPWWRRVVAHLHHGPEDWRLAYLSFGLLLTALFLPLAVLGEHASALIVVPFVVGPLGWIPLAGSFLCSRAVLTLLDEQQQSLGARKWLVYPSLLFVYAWAAAFILLGAGAVVGVVGRASYFHRKAAGSPAFQGMSADDVGYVALFIVIGCAVWWIILGQIFRYWPTILRVTFRPFADGLKPAWGHALSLTGVGLLVTVAAVAYWWLW